MFSKTSENMWSYEICDLDSAKCYSATGWQAALKKTGVKLELLTNIEILLVVEKTTRREICHAIHEYPKANNNYTLFFFITMTFISIYRFKFADFLSIY